MYSTLPSIPRAPSSKELISYSFRFYFEHVDPNFSPLSGPPSFRAFKAFKLLNNWTRGPVYLENRR